MTNELYEQIAKHFGMTVPQLKKRLVAGQPLVHQYYREKLGFVGEDSCPW
jgi:hypothetical protein